MKMCPPLEMRAREWAFMGRGDRNLRMPDFHPTGRLKKGLAGLLGLSSHARVPMPLTATRSGACNCGSCRPWTFLVSSDQQKTWKALSRVRGFFQYAVLCSSSPRHPVTALSGYFPGGTPCRDQLRGFPGKGNSSSGKIGRENGSRGQPARPLGLSTTGMFLGPTSPVSLKGPGQLVFIRIT